MDSDLSACNCTLASAHSPPTKPTIVPSPSTMAVSPALADVGRSARTTVAATKGTRRERRSSARRRTPARKDAGSGAVIRSRGRS